MAFGFLRYSRISTLVSCCVFSHYVFHVIIYSLYEIDKIVLLSNQKYHENCAVGMYELWDIQSKTYCFTQIEAIERRSRNLKSFLL